MTARAIEPLKAYRLAHGTLRGCLLMAQRVNSSPNARVLITTGVADLQSISLPKEPHILEALSIIWNIELPSITLDGLVKDVPSAKVTRPAVLQRFEQGDSRFRQNAGNGDKSQPTEL